MKIGFQADIIQGRRTGVGNYTLQMLRALKAVDPGLRFLDPQVTGWKDVALRSDDVGEAPIIRRVGGIGRLKSTLRDIEAARIAYRLGRNLAQRVTYRSRGVSIFHAFNFVPAVRPAAPCLPVVYDLSFIRHPDMHPPIRVRWLSRLPKVIEQAPLVHTISEFSKNEIVDVFNYPADRIIVAYPAASEQFHRLGQAARLPQLAALQLRWQGYMLAVGTLEPRKNLKTLLSAYAALPADVHARCPLVIAGGQGWGEEDRLAPAVQSLIRSGAVRFLGFVSDADLACLYEGASLMLYPSVYEGFGMPVVEAMACGARVAHSSGTSMDEIGDGLLIRIDPHDIAAWTEVMLSNLDSTDPDGAADARVARAGAFDWTASARLVRAGYDRMLGA